MAGSLVYQCSFYNVILPKFLTLSLQHLRKSEATETETGIEFLGLAAVNVTLAALENAGTNRGLCTYLFATPPGVQDSIMATSMVP